MVSLPLPNPLNFTPWRITRDERENPTRWLLRASERASRGDYLGKPLLGLPSSSLHWNCHTVLRGEAWKEPKVGNRHLKQGFSKVISVLRYDDYG